MGNKNNSNREKNQSADVQATVANNDEQKTDAATAMEVQGNAEQQNDTVTGNDAADSGGTEPPASVDPVPPNADENGDGKTDNTDPTPTVSAGNETETKTVMMTLRHKSHTPRYHRCGLTLTTVFAEYEVPVDCVERIKGDKWVEVKGAK